MSKARCAFGWAVVLLASTITAATADAAPFLFMTLQPTKAFHFTWTGVPGSTHYRLLEDPTGSSGFTQVGANIPATREPGGSFEHIVPLYRRVNARYIVQACNAAGCVDSNTVHASAPLTQAIGYFKASNVDESDRFGSAVALSADGTTLAVGAKLEDSSATGIGGNQSLDFAFDSGAVYVFVRAAGSSAWIQQAYIKAHNTDGSDHFGIALALSSDGSMLAVGADQEDGGTTGVNTPSRPNDNQVQNSGAVYVYKRVGSVWAQQAYIKASNTDEEDRFGRAVALSGNGAVLAVGATEEASNATGVNGNQFDESAPRAGAVYVFARSGSTWSQQAYIKGSNTEDLDLFGTALDLSSDGSTLAVSAMGESSSATGVNGNQLSNLAPGAGAVYVYVRVGAVWAQQAYIKASNTGEGDVFGAALALSANGAVLAVGAWGEDSTNNSAQNSGAVYVFGRTGSSWAQQAFLKASNIGAVDLFGSAVALSNDGATLAVGAPFEDSRAVGINGDETNDDALGSGAAYVFAKSNGVWTQRAYVKASNTLGTDVAFGEVVALAGNGGTLAVAASSEDGSASGINGPQVTLPLESSGAVYVY